MPLPLDLNERAVVALGVGQDRSAAPAEHVMSMPGAPILSAGLPNNGLPR